MDRHELLNYLNELLAIDKFEDACPNGLQIEGKSQVNRIVCGVSVSQRLFETAISRSADMIMVHHGLFWKGDPHPLTVEGVLRKRLELLLTNQLNLVAYHLPLDAHREYGNNILILNRLKIPVSEAYEIGFVGSPQASLTLAELHENVNRELQANAILFDFGPGKVTKVAVISGSSSFAVEEAAARGIDTFIGGDIRESHVRICEELGMNFIAAGHYNSEKFGVQALGKHIADKFGLESEFVDIPNPI